MKKRNFLMLGSIILILNLIWEFSHYPLYNDLTKIPSTLHLILASITDVFWVTFIFLSISLIHHSAKWLNKPLRFDYFLIVVFGLITASIIEIINLRLGRWSYKIIMPTILGIGLSPLLQLFTTGILALVLMRKINI